MKDQSLFDKIDLHLIRVLNTALKERSVSRAAFPLGMYQSVASTALRRLRDLAGAPLLVAAHDLACVELGQVAARTRAGRDHRAAQGRAMTSDAAMQAMQEDKPLNLLSPESRHDRP